MKFDAKGNKLSIKQDGGTKDIALDQVKTISAVPAFRLVSQDKFVYTSTAPITLHFKLTVNDQGEMKPASGESVTFTANKSTLAPITATTNDNGVATVVYTPKAYFWEPGFSDIIQGLYTFTDNGGNVSRYTARTYVEYNGDYTIECLTPEEQPRCQLHDEVRRHASRRLTHVTETYHSGGSRQCEGLPFFVYQ